jgi:hypothetical protein
MGTLSAGKRRGPDGECGRLRLHLDHHLLMAQKLDAGPAMLPPTPVLPEERFTPDAERMQEHANLARLCRRTAIPLTLLVERTGTATANAGAIHDTQAPIGFSAVFMREQLLRSRATHCPIGLKSKVLA